MKAIGAHIIIERLPEEVIKSSGGLELSEAQKDDVRYRKANVISPGTHVESVQHGDLILYDKFAGSGIEIGDEMFHVIQERDIVVVL